MQMIAEAMETQDGRSLALATLSLIRGGFEQEDLNQAQCNQPKIAKDQSLRNRF